MDSRASSNTQAIETRSNNHEHPTTADSDRRRYPARTTERAEPAVPAVYDRGDTGFRHLPGRRAGRLRPLRSLLAVDAQAGRRSTDDHRVSAEHPSERARHVLRPHGHTPDLDRRGRRDLRADNRAGGAADLAPGTCLSETP